MAAQRDSCCVRRSLQTRVALHRQAGSWHLKSCAAMQMRRSLSHSSSRQQYAPTRAVAAPPLLLALGTCLGPEDRCHTRLPYVLQTPPAGVLGTHPARRLELLPWLLLLRQGSLHVVHGGAACGMVRWYGKVWVRMHGNRQHSMQPCKPHLGFAHEPATSSATIGIAAVCAGARAPQGPAHQPCGPGLRCSY